VLGKGLEHGLHMSHTTYLALAAATSMLAVVVARAGRVGCGVCAGKGAEGESVLMMRRRKPGL